MKIKSDVEELFEIKKFVDHELQTMSGNKSGKMSDEEKVGKDPSQGSCRLCLRRWAGPASLLGSYRIIEPPSICKQYLILRL